MSDWDRTARNARIPLSLPSTTGPTVVGPSFPRAYAIGPDAGIAVEWGWSSWRDAVADRSAELREARSRRPSLLRVAASIVAIVAADVVVALGIVELVRGMAAMPRPAAVGILVAGALAGIALSRRTEGGSER